MAKKVTAQVKLQIPAGKATPAPPVGTALGPQGVNIMDFCKAFNAKTSAKDQEGLIIPVVIVANIPARLLIKSFGQSGWLIFHLVIAASIVFWLSRAFWQFALRRYSSASS